MSALADSRRAAVVARVNMARILASDSHRMTKVQIRCLRNARTALATFLDNTDEEAADAERDQEVDGRAAMPMRARRRRPRPLPPGD